MLCIFDLTNGKIVMGRVVKRIDDGLRVEHPVLLQQVVGPQGQAGWQAMEYIGKTTTLHLHGIAGEVREPDLDTRLQNLYIQVTTGLQVATPSAVPKPSGR